MSKLAPFTNRQHMERENFEIFRYRDSYLKDVALHHHDFFELYLFLAGDVTYSVESINYNLRPGDLLLINPMELHRPIITPARQPYERMVLWINVKFLRQLSTGATDLARCFDPHRPRHTNLLRPEGEAHQRVVGLMTELLADTQDSGYGGDVRALAHLLELLELANRLSEAAVSRHTPREEQGDPLIGKVLRYINLHCAEELSLEQLAAQHFVSKYYLSHRFSQLVGSPVYRYIIQKRLMLAKQLLGEGMLPTVAYTRCGFGDYANFYRAFKAEYGTSPKEWAR